MDPRLGNFHMLWGQPKKKKKREREGRREGKDGRKEGREGGKEGRKIKTFLVCFLKHITS